MEKLPKILRIVLFALWAVAGLLLAIDTGMFIPDAQKISTNSLIFTIVETCLFIAITIIGLLATIKAIKTQEEFTKLDKRNNPIVLLVGITLAVVAYSQFMILQEMAGSYGVEVSMPSEILTIIIFGVLVIIATITVKVLKIKGEPLPNFIRNSVVGALALITIFIFLSYFKPEGLTMFGMILLLIAIIAYIGLPYIYKDVPSKKWKFKQLLEDATYEIEVRHQHGYKDIIVAPLSGKELMEEGVDLGKISLANSESEGYQSRLVYIRKI